MSNWHRSMPLWEDQRGQCIAELRAAKCYRQVWGDSRHCVISVSRFQDVVLFGLGIPVKKITDGRGGSGSKVGEAPADVGNISEAVDVERKNIKIGQLPLLDGWRSDSRNGHGRKSKDERGLHFYDVIGKDVRDQSSCCLEVMIEECDCEC
jgi:hypothetical protein